MSASRLPQACLSGQVQGPGGSGWQLVVSGFSGTDQRCSNRASSATRIDSREVGFA
ncbi:hypothetical protein OIU84_024432, partial [Salix udensis]